MNAKARRAAQDSAIVPLLADRLEPAVRDDASVQKFLERYGPIDLEVATATVDQQVAARGRDLHVRNMPRRRPVSTDDRGSPDDLSR